MKTLFTKAEIISKRGCYERDQVEALSFINNPEISMVDVLKSEISIRDKRWFLWNHGEMSLDQKKELAFLLAKDVSGIFNKRYPNDNRVNECLQAIQDFRDGKIKRGELWNKRAAAAAAYAAYAAADAAAYAAAAAADAADAAYAAAAAADAADAADAAYAADAADAADAAYAADAADAADAAADAADGKAYSQVIQDRMIAFIESQLITA